MITRFVLDFESFTYVYEIKTIRSNGLIGDGTLVSNIFLEVIKDLVNLFGNSMLRNYKIKKLEG